MNTRQLSDKERDEERWKNALNKGNLRLWVMTHINVGGTFKAPHDAYNYQPKQEVVADSEREVVGFYENFVLTKDEFGKSETYQYYDLFELLRRQGK